MLIYVSFNNIINRINANIISNSNMLNFNCNFHIYMANYLTIIIKFQFFVFIPYYYGSVYVNVYDGNVLIYVHVIFQYSLKFFLAFV